MKALSPNQVQDYLQHMESMLQLELDPVRRAELQGHFQRLAAMAEPLMDLELDSNIEIAGVFQP